MKKIADTFKERDNNLVFIFFLELDFESCLKSLFHKHNYNSNNYKNDNNDIIETRSKTKSTTQLK